MFLMKGCDYMSRSYKKHPCIKESSPHTKYGKKFANRKVRKSEETLQHKDYKKQYCSWEISDYRFYMTRKEVISEFFASRAKEYHWMKQFATLKEALTWWKKTYLRK